MPDIDAADSSEDVWIGEGAYPGFIASASTTSIASDSADDAAAGTGARTVRVVGIVNNAGTWTETQEDVTLNGVTPVDRKSTRLNSSHSQQSRMPSSA